MLTWCYVYSECVESCVDVWEDSPRVYINIRLLLILSCTAIVQLRVIYVLSKRNVNVPFIVLVILK